MFLTACGGNEAYIDRGYAPVANAGEDQNIIAGATVMLDGSKSTDDDGDALSYSWILLEKPQGSTSTLNNSDNVEVSFTPDIEGEYVFQLIVNDGTVDSPLDTVKIIVTSIPSSQTCTPNTTESRDCSIDNGSGSQARTCATDGLSWGDYENCAVSSCNTGYHEEGNSCVVNPPAQICTPNTTESQSCSIDNGSGSQTRSCAADGLSWNNYESCAVTSCNSGYHQEDNACVVDAPTQVCTPNATEERDCAIDNGLGSQTRACATDGLAWGNFESCATNSCNTGYHKEGNSCVVNPPAQICTPNTKESQSCSINNGSGSQTRSCAADGLSWNNYESCAVTSCNSGYHKEANTCVVDAPIQVCTPNATEERDCAIDNGLGSQTRACATDGLAWGNFESCGVSSCNTGYHKEGNTCVIDAPTQVCTPNATEARDCAIDNGLGSQTRACAADGLAWGDYENCAVSSCNTDYHKVDNICVADTPNNIPPTVNAGSDETINEGELASLLATASDDGVIIKVEWFNKDDVLLGSELGLALTNLVLGDHTLTVKVTDDEGLTATDEVKITIKEDDTILGSLSGKIVDQKGVLIINAKVTLATGQSAISNGSGDYLLNNIKPIERTTVTASRNELLQNSEIVRIESGKETVQNIILSRPKSVSIFDARKGKTVVTDGLVVKLPKGDYTNKNGKNTDGDATLSASYFPITTEEGINEFPGDTLAENDAGEVGNLTSIGFIKLELKDDSGNNIELPKGEKIELSIPADDNLDKPATIPLWYFDDDKGLWVEDGVATYDPVTDSYRTAVDIVATFNLDHYDPTIIGSLEVCVEDRKGNKVEASVAIEPSDKSWRRISKTSIDGLLRLSPIIAENNFNLFAITKSGQVGGFASNPVYLTAGNNKPNECIIIEGESKTESYHVSGTIVDSDGKVKPNAKIVVYGIVGGQGVGSPSLVGLSKTFRSDSEGDFNIDFAKEHSVALELALFESKELIIKVISEESYNLKGQKEFTLSRDTNNLSIGDIVIQPNKPPVANAGLDQVVYIDEVVTLDGAKSYDRTGSLITSGYTFEWREGDKVVGTSQKIVSRGLTLGEHIIVLTITDEFGLKSSDEVLIRVLSKEQKIFANAGRDREIYRGGESQLSAYGSRSVGGTIRYRWTENEELLSESRDFNYKSNIIGEHKIKLTVTNENGLEDSDELTVMVTEPYLIVNMRKEQVIHLGESVLIGADVLFNHITYLSTHTFKWTEGDIELHLSTSSWNQSPASGFSYKATKLGVHTIKLMVTNEQGVIYEGTQKITVLPSKLLIPTFVNAGVDRTVTLGEDVYLGVSGEFQSSLIYLYKWFEGDTLLSEEKSFQHIGLEAGSHTFKVIVTDNKGVSDTDEVTVLVKAPNDKEKDTVVANAGVDKTIYLNDELYIEGNHFSTSNFKPSGYSFFDYSWSEGGASINSRFFNDKGFVYEAKDLGVHTIKLEVSDSFGNGVNVKDVDEVIITVIKKPESGSAFNLGPDQVMYVGSNTLFRTDDVSYKSSLRWEVDGVEESTNSMFRYTPQTTGEHKIKITIIDEDGTISTDEVIITAIDPPDVFLTAYAGKDMGIFLGSSIALHGSYLSSKELYGTSITNRSTKWTEDGKGLELYVGYGGVRYYKPTELGLHTLQYEVTIDGETSTDEVIISVTSGKEYIVADAGPDRVVYLGTKLNGARCIDCIKGSAYSSRGITSKQWKEGKNVLSNFWYVNEYEATTLGKHTLTYTVESAAGIATDEVEITVIPDNRNYILNVNAGIDREVTIEKFVDLRTTGSYNYPYSALTYEWKEGDTILSTNGYYRYQAKTLGLHTLKLTITNANGATATDEVNIMVKEPYIGEIFADAGLDQTIYQGTKASLNTGNSYARNSNDFVSLSAEWTEGTKLLSQTGRFMYEGLDIGTHTLKLTVKDTTGKLVATDEVTITVIDNGLVDLTKPVITIIGDSHVTVKRGSNYIDQGATALDDRDGVITTNIITINGIFTTARVGTYGVQYRVTDRAGNSVSIIRTVEIITDGADTTPPVITVLGDNPATIFQSSPNRDYGGYIGAGLSIIDNYDGEIGYTYNSNIDKYKIGTYQIVYTAKDKAGNTSTVTRTVNVIADPNIIIDTTLPVITLKGNQTVSLVEGSVYTDAGATAIDETDGDITASILVDNPVDTNVVKDYTVMYTVKDKAGNEASLTRTVKVNKKPDEPDTLPLILVKSLEWLETQKQADGAYSNSAQIVMNWQSTSEVLRAYHKVGETSAAGIVLAKTFMNAEDSKKVEALARKIILGLEAGDNVSTSVAELIKLQNIDSGFGDQMHYHSRVTDTAFALKALGMAKITDTSIASKAINYLKTQQSAEGGYSHSSKNNDSIYETALVLLALDEFKGTFNLTDIIGSTTQYLMDNQAAGGAWDSHWESALALLAIEPTADNKVAYQAAADKLKAAQLTNGSWSNEVYTTALAIRAIYKAENLD